MEDNKIIIKTLVNLIEKYKKKAVENSGEKASLYILTQILKLDDITGENKYRTLKDKLIKSTHKYLELYNEYTEDLKKILIVIDDDNADIDSKTDHYIELLNFWEFLYYACIILKNEKFEELKNQVSSKAREYAERTEDWNSIFQNNLNIQRKTFKNAEDKRASLMGINDDDLLDIFEDYNYEDDFDEIIFSNECVEGFAFKCAAGELSDDEKQEFSMMLDKNADDAEAYLFLKRLMNLNDDSLFINSIRENKQEDIERKKIQELILEKCEKIFVNKILVFHFQRIVSHLAAATPDETPLDIRVIHQDKNMEIAVYFYKTKAIIKILSMLKKLNLSDVSIYLNYKKIEMQKENGFITAEISGSKLKKKNNLTVIAGRKKIETEIIICGN